MPTGHSFEGVQSQEVQLEMLSSATGHIHSEPCRTGTRLEVAARPSFSVPEEAMGFQTPVTTRVPVSDIRTHKLDGHDLVVDQVDACRM